MKNSKMLIAQVCAVFGFTSAAMAEGNWTIGFGLGTETELYRDDDTSLSGFPFIAYDTETFHIGFDGLAYKVVNTSRFGFNLNLSPRGGPDFPDTALFQGLDRDTAIEIGFSARQTFANDVYVQAAFLHDVSSAHEGYEAQAHLGTSFSSGSVNFDASVGVRYRNDDMNAYLVGVSGAEANGSRSAYAPGSTLSPLAQFSATVPVSDRAAVVGSLSYERFGGSYDNSPLTKKGSQASAGVAIIYKF
ncbi:MipA/OmpV family protein [uncultured Roseobacter sp.]|uniref:MipA/OmpV family protein n=1 Tax=uncultured Roseobacter sp. TaxID=114847 RepID=UPI002637C31B|nr:MipA/OmpV family protein [uncultured Roseobacter sp.]